MKTLRNRVPTCLFLLLMWLAALPALAHKPSDAYLSLRIDGAVIEQRVDIALRDLDRELELDADGDRQLSWGEVRRRGSDIERWVDEGVQLTADDQPCEPAGRQPLQLDEHVDGRYAVLQRSWRCTGSVTSLALRYGLMARSDASHRGLLRIVAQDEQSAVLVPGGPAMSFALGGTAGQGTRSFGGFVAEGLHHIAIGLDHVLFIVTLLMVTVWQREGARWVPRERAVSAWREALQLVTAFTLAHSLTLGLAAAGVLAPPSRWVETLIAGSVLVAALDNLWPFVRGPRWVMVSVFGLVHGFGFAGPLQDLGLRDGELAVPLLGFNLGVELGQLLLVALLLPAMTVLRGHGWYRLAVVRGGSGAVAVLAAVWTLERGFDVALWP